MAYFIDIQGTLIDDLDKRPIEGALEFVDSLNAAGVPYILVTNNTKTPSKEFFAYLQSLGFAIRPENYIDPLMVLTETVAPTRVAAYGDEKFLNLLQTLGYELDFNAPEAVLVGMKKDFSAQEYAQMIDLILGGAKLVGMHATSIYAKDGKRYPGIGAILSMLHYATSCEYEVVGKPSRLFYTKALHKLRKGDFAGVTMISDDHKGDLLGAKELGMETVLVLSGKIKDAQEVTGTLPKSKHPDKILENIGKLNR